MRQRTECQAHPTSIPFVTRRMKPDTKLRGSNKAGGKPAVTVPTVVTTHSKRTSCQRGRSHFRRVTFKSDQPTFSVTMFLPETKKNGREETDDKQAPIRTLSEKMEFQRAKRPACCTRLIVMAPTKRSELMASQADNKMRKFDKGMKTPHTQLMAQRCRAHAH